MVLVDNIDVEERLTFESSGKVFSGERVELGEGEVLPGMVRSFTWENGISNVPHEFKTIHFLVVQKSSRVKNWYDVCFVHTNEQKATLKDIIVPSRLAHHHSSGETGSGWVGDGTRKPSLIVTPEVKSHMSTKFIRKNTSLVGVIPLCVTHSAGVLMKGGIPLNNLNLIGCGFGCHVFTPRHFLGRERALWKQELSSVASLIR